MLNTQGEEKEWKRKKKTKHSTQHGTWSKYEGMPTPNICNMLALNIFCMNKQVWRKETSDNKQY